MIRKIIVTDDNSKSIYVESLNETYHSTHGALQEAQHVFIEHGLKSTQLKKNVKIFEMGFGTGLNAILTIIYCLENNLPLYYIGVEKYPLSQIEIEQVNSTHLPELKKFSALYKLIHASPYNQDVELAPNIILKKIHADVRSIELPLNFFTLIYYDAFGPKIQPDLWSAELMKKMYESLASQGKLVTYCAQGQFRRNLKEAGFMVERLAGPIGKREITSATKSSEL
ncbi:MAG: tRNA (5-methylaminomethyl-2-thiouridine)(34)-methyltransferase MnmD [Crocinitomicaceae bacterium]|nr:tRNA (5-methylaminomethyl-2-thiouridine)(34)-methyltransferase MnmD [Crocinitomicaceae bacterium]